MRSCLRSIQVLLILVFIGSISITPASFAKDVTFPEPYDCYRSYATITSRMAELTDLYPDLARLETIGQSFEGRPIQVLQLGWEGETNTKPRLVLISGLKANALALVELNLIFAETLLESYGRDADISWLLDETGIHLILIANPDGRLIAEQQAQNSETPTWTKNRQAYDCATGDGGVSLDQNFSYEWSPVSTDACAVDYPGPLAGSEPETQAIQTYLEQIVAQNPERSLVIDLQNESYFSSSDKLITPYLYSKTAENILEDELYMLANKLAFSTQQMPLRGSSDDIRILTGNLTDFSFGHLQAPSLRFNLGPQMSGGEVTECWYFDDYLKPEGIRALTRAAMLAAGPLTLSQGPEITITNIDNDVLNFHIVGQADDMNFYKMDLNQDEYSDVHHVSFSLDSLPWQPDAVILPVDWSEPVSGAPFAMDFEHSFVFTELSPGKHTAYFQAWDTAPSGEPGQAGMINAVEITVPLFTFIPLIIR